MADSPATQETDYLCELHCLTVNKPVLQVKGKSVQKKKSLLCCGFFLFMPRLLGSCLLTPLQDQDQTQTEMQGQEIEFLRHLKPGRSSFCPLIHLLCHPE